MKKKYFTEEERKAAKARSAKKYRENNKEKVRERYLNWKRNNKEKLDEYRQTRRCTKEGYVDRFLERAKATTPDTDLDREFFEGLMDRCCVTGKEFMYKNPYDCYHNPLAPSIDRIDNTKGYYRSNVQVILSCLNRFKNDMPNKDFLELWKALTEGN